MMNGCELSRMGAREPGSRKRKEIKKKRRRGRGRKEEERRNEPSAIDGLHRNCIECIRASYPRRVALQWVQQRPQRSCSNIVFRRGEYRDYGDYGGGTPCGHKRDRLIPVLFCPGINPSCFAREALSRTLRLIRENKSRQLTQPAKLRLYESWALNKRRLESCDLFN